MSNLRAQLRNFLLERFEQFMPGSAAMWFDIIILCWFAITAVILHLIFRALIKHFLKGTFNGKHGNQRINNKIAELRYRLAKRLSFVLQGAIVIIQARLWLDDESSTLHVLDVLTDQWIILFSLLSLYTLLDIFQAISDRHVSKVPFPIRGLLQTIKLIASVFTAILAISILMNQSPLVLLSGLGALSAVLLLVFKDSILGLVAGIQLSANNMLTVGDWLEMPKYGADGDVIDIALTTVKVQNWDKTITTIPTYALISDSFKNWRGMSQAGGRRIKRSIHIEMSSVSFLSKDQIEALYESDLLSDYLSQTVSEVEKINNQKKTNTSIMLDGRGLTNVGTFRNYLVNFLKQHPHIHQDMSLMVRQLEPSSNGLPIEIYAFTNTTKWNEYETIQSDIFDHIIAVLPAFSLRAHESPTGNDIRALAQTK